MGDLVLSGQGDVEDATDAPLGEGTGELDLDVLAVHPRAAGSWSDGTPSTSSVPTYTT